MKIIVLGSGTSTGVPLPGCPCEVCNSSDPKDKRNRTSIFVETDQGTSILVDTSPDLRHQSLAYGVKKIDAVLYTHAHADHILGLEDLRAFNFVSKKSIPLFATEESTAGLKRCFGYVFHPDPNYMGGLLPQVTITTIKPFVPFTAAQTVITPIPLLHGNMEVLGFRIGNFAYCTDCNEIPETSMNALQGLEVLILDGLRFESSGRHKTHFMIEDSIKTIIKLAPKQAYLTHMTHSVSHERDSKHLPSGVEFAYDGLEISVTSF